MANDEQPRPEEQVPPRGEPVHLPDPSYLPVVVALGVTLAVVGVVVNLVLCGIGAVIAVYAIVRWIGQTRQEISDLPLEH
jgi:hypothetical protein